MVRYLYVPPINGKTWDLLIILTHDSKGNKMRAK